MGQAKAFLAAKRTLGGLAVAGDVGIDRFAFGVVDRISPEAPVPVLAVDRFEERPGCAANVVENIAALKPLFDFPLSVVSVVGDDEAGRTLGARLKAIANAPLVVDKERPTTLKTRYIAGTQHQLLRVDQESVRPLTAAVAAEAERRIEALLGSIKVLVVQDYAKGFFDGGLMSRVLKKARAAGVMTIVDPHSKTPAETYRGAGLVTPNVAEAEKLLGRSLHRGVDDQEIADAALELKTRFDLDRAIITRSGHGMTLADKSGSIRHFPAVARAVYDVTGAGDTVVALLAAGFAGGLDADVACLVATAAASVVVGKVGTASATPAEILTELERSFGRAP